MAATPLTVGDIVGGHLLWMALRVAATVSLMAVVVVALGGLSSRAGGALVPANVAFGRHGRRRRGDRLRRPARRRRRTCWRGSGSGSCR